MDSSRILLLRKLVAAVCDDASTAGASTRTLASAIHTNNLLVEDSTLLLPKEYPVVVGLLDQLYNGLYRRMSQKKADAQATAAVELMVHVLGSCSQLRLLQNMGRWGEALVEGARREGSKGPLKAASLSALSSLFNRLAEVMEVTGVKREAAALVGRLQPLLLPCLSDAETPTPVLTAALALLATLLSVLPTSLRQHSSALERHFISLAKAPPPGLLRPAGGPHPAARGLALLPRAAGDAAAWSGMCRRSLLSAHEILDLVFMGLENPESTSRAKAPLYPEGTPASTPAQGLLGIPAADPQPKDLPPLLHTFCTNLDVLETLLTSGYPTPVPLPTGGVLHLARRILDFDATAAVSAGGVPYSSHFYADLCLAMPALHEAAWRLTTLLLQVAGNQTTPHQAPLARLLQLHLRRLKQAGPLALVTTPASVRHHLYVCAAVFARTSGLGPTRTLAPEASAAALLELYGADVAAATSRQAGGAKPSAASAVAAANGPKHKKPRTQAADLGDIALALDLHASKAAIAAPAPQLAPTLSPVTADLAAQAAAVELLEAVAAVAGPALPPDVRAQLDAVVYHAASSSAAAAAAAERQPAGGAAAAGGGARAPLLRRLQAGAYRALVASVLSPCAHRPPFLSEAVQLFQAGTADLCPQIADLSRQALLSLEALLHPRCTPVSGTQQYLGMEEVPPLHKPRMWTPLISSPSPVPLALPQQQPQVPAANGNPRRISSNALPPVPIHPTTWGLPPPQSGRVSSPLPPSSRLQVTPSAPPPNPDPASTSPFPKEPSLDMWMAHNSSLGMSQLPPSHTLHPTISLAPATVQPTLSTGAPLPSLQPAAFPLLAPSTSQAPAPAPLSPLGSSPLGSSFPPLTASLPAPLSTAPAAAEQAAGAAMVAAAVAAAEKARSVFGDESSDSEGALPEIDSGEDDSDSDDDTAAAAQL